MTIIVISRTFSIALTGNDLTDGSGRKIQGSQRFMAALNYLGTDFSKVLPKGLNNLHLPFSNTIIQPGAVEYMTRTYQLGVAATGKEGVFFGKELSDEERINFGLRLMAPYVGQAIGDTISGDNIIEAFKEAGIELGKDIYKGTQAWSQMAVQAYQNASNLASYLHIPTPDVSIPKDQDAYIRLDIAQELGKTFKSIRDTGSDIFTSIREVVREARKDYDLRIAYKKGELPADVLAQKLNNKEINVEDVYQLAVTYGADATKLIALATKNATNQELMNLINKAGGSKEISEALKVERNNRIDEAIKGLSSAIEVLNSNPLLGGINVNDRDKVQQEAEKNLLPLMQLGTGTVTINGNEINLTLTVGVSTTTFAITKVVDGMVEKIKGYDPAKESKLSDHWIESVSIDEFIKHAEGKSLWQLKHEKDEGLASEIRAGGPNDKYRYVRDPNNPNRVIDMRHFLVVGSNPFGEQYGNIVEEIQGSGDRDSAFHPQDYFSNALGVLFFQISGFYEGNSIPFSVQLKNYFDWWTKR
ncbi:MAG: hypothetical protein AB1414_19165 [bacterium]